MDRIKMLRERTGMSQAKLAVLADMNPVTLWRYETGQRSPTVDQLERLAEVLEVEVGDFFPKDQPRLPLEDRPGASFFFADAIASTAGKWLEDLDEMDASELAVRLGIYRLSAMAHDLRNSLITVDIGEEELSEEAYQKAMDRLGELGEGYREEVVRLWNLLTEVTEKAGRVLDAAEETQKVNGE